MPVVPSSNGPMVPMGQTPTPRTSIEDFGGGEAARPIDLAPIANEVQRIYQVEKQKADQVAVVDAGSKLSALETSLLFDPSRGVLSQRGKNAMGAQDAAMQEWTTQTADIENGLSNNDQKAQFRRMVASHGASLNEQMQRHVSTERATYEKEAVSSYVTNEQNAALASGLTDPNRVQQAIDNQRAAITDFGTRNGWSDDAIKEHVAQTVSATRYGVLERMVNAEQDLAATNYLTQHRDEFVGRDLQQAERLTDAGSVRADSQRRADDITTTATDLTAALRSVHDIQDPRIRDATEERVRRHYADQATDARQERDAAFQRASSTLEQTKDYDAIPLSDRLKLTPEENDSLLRHAQNLRNPKTVTNIATYTHLMNLAALNDATRAEFLGMNFADPSFRKQLSDEDIKHFATLQREMRVSDVRTDAADERRADHATDALHRKEEAEVIRQSRKETQASATRAAMEKITPGGSKYAPPPVRVAVPKWMVDSAAHDPEYAGYLRFNGVPLNRPAASGTSGSSGPVDFRTPPNAPKAPGAPILRAAPTSSPSPE